MKINMKKEHNFFIIRTLTSNVNQKGEIVYLTWFIRI